MCHIRQQRTWQLAAVIGLDEHDPVQCQAPSHGSECGRRVWSRVHMIIFDDGRVECWGSGCYRRELGEAPQKEPLFPHIDGRKLTVEEREVMRLRREDLIAQFRAELQAQESDRGELRLPGSSPIDRPEADPIIRAPEPACPESGDKGEERARWEPKAPSGWRPSAALKVGERFGTLYPVHPLRKRARDIVIAGYIAQDLDPEAPGWAGQIEAETDRELARLLKAKEAPEDQGGSDSRPSGQDQTRGVADTATGPAPDQA
jgi:hypothetical protein